MSVQRTTTMQVAAFQDLLVQPQTDVLGILSFSGKGGVPDKWSGPLLPVCMRRLDGVEHHCETWRGRGPVTTGRRGDLEYSHDGEALFGVVTLQDSRFDFHDGKTPLRQAAALAYRNVFALADELGYRYYYRFWNYLPDINQPSHGLERYRQFNLGRQDAFVAQGYDETAGYPAACALGSAQGPLSIAFLAGHARPQRIENPRQVSAYHYPEQYGPRTPLFSRATWVTLAGEAVLLVSGTASVVGHATQHAGDVTAQVRETVANIQAILAQANRISGGTAFEMRDLSCRVYVRNPDDFQRVRAELTQCAGAALNAVYLQADICRQDLLLEIEAVASHAVASPTPGAQG